MKYHRRRSRSAVSEVIATIVLISVTVVLGSVLYVWANSSAASSEGNFNGVAGEKFEIASTSFSYSPSSISIWVYNSGRINTHIVSIEFSIVPNGGTCNATTTTATTTTTTLSTSVTFASTSTSTASGWSVPIGVLTLLPPIGFNPPIIKYSLVTIKAFGQYGFFAIYSVVAC